ncbi:MAG: N-acetylglucosamine kinase [Thermomicrobiales bacterium]
MTPRSLLMAVDGGQTATKALIATVEGNVLAAGRGGPSDHFHGPGGVEKNRRAIHEAVRSALAAAGADADEVVAIGLGLTGAPTGGEQTPVVHEIVREILPEAAVTVVADYVTNLAGASAGEPGVVIIAGGGAIGYGLTADGREALAGGFGYLLGDEGSAFDIGLRAIAAACRAEDHRGESTRLRAVVLEHFGIETMRTIPRIVYRAGFPREQISLLAPAVATAARAGDQAARGVMATAGEELATTALGVIRQLFTEGESVAVYLTGGVFGAGEVLLTPLRSTLGAGWATAEARSPAFPPAVGGLILAARALNGDPDDSWVETVRATLARTES